MKKKRRAGRGAPLFTISESQRVERMCYDAIGYCQERELGVNTRHIFRRQYETLWLHRVAGSTKAKYTKFTSVAANQMHGDIRKKEVEQAHCRSVKTFSDEIFKLYKSSVITPETILPILKKYEVLAFFTKAEHELFDNTIHEWTDEPELISKCKSLGIELIKNTKCYAD
jgi:hypothetical protein